MIESEIIKKTIHFVKKELAQAEGGHDWFHVERVFKNTLLIAKEEKVNLTVVSLAALLHDIADSKFHNGNEEIGLKIAERFLIDENVPQKIITHVVEIIKNMSFKNSFGKNENKFSSIELKVVHDADGLDAIGAIGIARCFNYGGFKNRALYNPEILPNLNLTKEEYKNSTAPTINHFYEKLLLLKDKMNTTSGKKIAENRHQFMVNYLSQFYDEWNGKL